MKEENEINREVKQLLDSLEQHGRNARRQQELSDLIDELETGGLDCFVPRKDAKRVQVSTNDAKRRKLYPLWWVVGAAAACLLLWLLLKPTATQNPETNEEILVEKTNTVDSIELDGAVLEEPARKEQLLAEEKIAKQQNTRIQTEKARTVVEEELMAEAGPKESSEAIETNDTMNTGSNTIPNSPEEKLSIVNCQLSTNSSPQRRVIRSLNLVCYECQKEPEYVTKTETENRTIFGQPQDPNMKNGSLAFELKLH